MSRRPTTPHPRYRRPVAALRSGVGGLLGALSDRVGGRLPLLAAGAPDEARALRVLHDVTRRVHASLDLGETLDAVARGALEATCFGVVVINLRLPSGDFEVVSVEGEETARAELMGLVEPAEQWTRLLDSAEPWGALRFVSHTSALADLDDTMYSWVPPGEPSTERDAWHPHDALFAPLVAPSGLLLGALSVDLPEGGRRPTRAQCEVLELFAAHAAIAIEHARMTAELEVSRDEMAFAAHHDALTGLANRALLMERGAAAAAASGGRLAVLVLDLDRFKAVNDAAGHLAGDEVLQVLAERMRGCVRSEDLLARAGGDEFAVVMRLRGGRDCEAVARGLADRLRAACAEPVHGLAGTQRVGVSVGIAVADTPVEFEDVLARADAAMFAEKRAARTAHA